MRNVGAGHLAAVMSLARRALGREHGCRLRPALALAAQGLSDPKAHGCTWE